MTNKLKQLTWAHHQAAERRKFAKQLISGGIDPFVYYKFLNCQYLVYEVLEKSRNHSATSTEHPTRATYPTGY